MSACLSTETPAPTTVAAAPSIAPSELVGRWGLGSYHRDTDRDRTLKEARAQCGNPYVIKPSPTGGVIMNLADQSEASDLQLKAGPDGRTFIGRGNVAGEITDMEISAYDGKTMTIQWLDPDVVARYGTMVYVRCGPANRAASPAKPKTEGSAG